MWANKLKKICMTTVVIAAVSTIGVNASMSTLSAKDGGSLYDAKKESREEIDVDITVSNDSYKISELTFGCINISIGKILEPQTVKSKLYLLAPGESINITLDLVDTGYMYLVCKNEASEPCELSEAKITSLETKGAYSFAINDVSVSDSVDKMEGRLGAPSSIGLEKGNGSEQIQIDSELYLLYSYSNIKGTDKVDFLVDRNSHKIISIKYVVSEE